MSARGAAGRGTGGGTTLIGREAELAQLEAAVARARAGRGQFCLLTGEAGIGKSSLADVVAQQAHDEGVLVRWGRAWQVGGAPAFWPWVQILRGLVRDRPLEELQRRLGSGAPWIARIVPELRERLPELDASASIETDQARFALFDAVATFLRNVSEDRPLALLIDDLHAADPPSVLLLDFVARNTSDAPVFVLAAYQESAARGRPEVDSLIAELAREGRRVTLGRLGAGELGTLVEERAGTRPPPELVEELHGLTGGNPFFANELVQLLAADGELRTRDVDEEGRAFPLPDSVRDAIRLRFKPLGAEAVETLQVAALIGHEFRLATLERATGATRESLIDMLDAASRRGLVAKAGSAGLHRFAHGLMRETLSGDLPHARRISAHGAVGDALEDFYAPDTEPHLAELAHHFLEAAPGGYAEKAVDYATRAGERAMRLLAYEQADRLFESALGALDLFEAEPRVRAELLLSLGGAHVRSGNPSARETLIAAASAARTLEAPELLGEAALAFRAFARIPGVVDEEVVGLLEEALERLDPGDSPLRARLLVRLALQLYDRFDAVDRRRELADEAIAMARRVGDRATLAYVLHNAQLATWGPDSREQALGWSREVLELAEGVREIDIVRGMHNRLVDLLLELDDLTGADVEIEALDRIVRDTPEPRAQSHLASQRSRRAAIDGRFDDAERLNEDAEELGAKAGDTSMAVVAAGQRYGLAWMRGRLPEVEAMSRRFADALPGMFVWRAALTRVYCEVGREPEARREWERLAADGFACIPRNDSWMFALALLAEVCALLGDADRAEALAGQLEPFAGRNVVPIHSVFAGPVDRYLGLLATTRGDFDAAAEHLAAAERAAERSGARPILAMLALDRARLLAARDGPDDRGRAAEAAAEAAELAESIGADGLARAAEELRSTLEDGPALPTEPRAEPRAATARLCREGDVWLFDYEDRSVRVRDSKGLRYLAQLLQNPGAEVHALELVGAGDGSAGDGSAAADAGLTVGGDDSAGPLLDAEAKAAYRERLDELREELEEAESFNDPERAARAREEAEFVARELAGAVGLGGRDRKVASNAERARVNVTRAIRGVLKRVADFDPDLGRELESTVRTGTFCAYEPDPRRPVTWTIEER